MAASPVAVGVDLVSVDRIARLLERHPRARNRLFTEGELADCEGRRRAEEHLAARFAAKEAVFKLLGRGIGQGVGWREVEILNEESGRPVVRLSGGAAALAEQQRLSAIELSISHAAGLAIAQAVALRAG